MATRHRRKSRFSYLILPAVLAAVSAYFVHQSARGQYGDEARAALRAERAAKADELAGLIERREALQRRVLKLRTDALDADLLDERVRRKLNLAHPNELVILFEPEPVVGRTAALR